MQKKTSLGRGNNKNKSPEVVGYVHKEKRGSQLCWSRVIMEGLSSRLTENQNRAQIVQIVEEIWLQLPVELGAFVEF